MWYFLIGSIIYIVQYFTDNFRVLGVFSSFINGMNPALELIVSIILLTIACGLLKLSYKIKKQVLAVYILIGLLVALILFSPFSVADKTQPVNYLEFSGNEQEVYVSHSFWIFNLASFGPFIIFFILNIPNKTH